MLKRIIFIVLVCGTRAQNVYAPFTYSLYKSGSVEVLSAGTVAT
jgi:hypothetical protein